MIRPWRRPPAPMWLDLADEMGVLVVGSPALECMRLPLSTPYLPSRVEQEIRQAVLRDRNRACVVQWELFNELHRPILKQMMRPMALLTRELDPTRLILDESGGWAFGARMYLPYEYEPTRFNDIHTYPGPFINKRLFDGFLTIGMTEEEKKSSGLNVKDTRSKCGSRPDVVCLRTRLRQPAESGRQQRAFPPRRQSADARLPLPSSPGARSAASSPRERFRRVSIRTSNSSASTNNPFTVRPTNG